MVEEQNKIMEQIRAKEKERRSQEKACEKFESQNSEKSNTFERETRHMEANLTRSNSSSMQILRRILEIEEWRKTSDIFNMRMEKQSLLENK